MYHPILLAIDIFHLSWSLKLQWYKQFLSQRYRNRYRARRSKQRWPSRLRTWSKQGERLVARRWLKFSDWILKLFHQWNKLLVVWCCNRPLTDWWGCWWARASECQQQYAEVWYSIQCNYWMEDLGTSQSRIAWSRRRRKIKRRRRQSFFHRAITTFRMGWKWE